MLMYLLFLIFMYVYHDVICLSVNEFLIFQRQYILYHHLFLMFACTLICMIFYAFT